MADNEKFLILDGHSLAYRAFHALPPENFQTSTGQHTNAVYGFVSMLISVLKEQQPTHIAVAFDLSRDTFRSRQYPEYKATRAKTPVEFKGQVELVKEILEALKIPVVTAETFEADDILATLSRAATVPVRIVTGDRDSFQLISDNVGILYPGQKMSDLRLMNDEAVQEKYGVPSNRYRDLAALVGESSDNLPGVPGVGPKTAAKWITQYGSLDEILKVADTIAGKVGEALREHIDQVRLNYELNRLIDTVPIEREISAYLKSPYNTKHVHEILDSLEFATLRPRLLAAWPSSESATLESSVEEPKSTAVVVDVVADEIRGAGIGDWLATHGQERTAVAFAGSWKQGRGHINHVAFVAQNGRAAWCEYSSDELASWLAGSTAKAIHDAKGPMLALLNDGIQLGGLHMDTAIAAYLVSSGARSFTLEDISQRYLDRSLTPADSTDTSQMLFADSTFSGLDLARQARATLDLAEYFERELAERGGLELMKTLELPLVSVLAEMEVCGIAVDVDQLKSLEQSFDDDAQAAVRSAHSAVGHEFNLGSPKQLQEVLFEERKLPKTKKIKTGYTTDAEALQGLLAQVPDDELLVALLRYREVSKLRQTVTGLLSCVLDDNRIHSTFNQMVAATGRLSSTDPNLQNIPVRTQEGGRIRDTFVVGRGYETLITADYSQIELRVMAHLSQDEGLIAALKSGEDLHTTVGSQVFGVPTSQVTPDMRRQIKAMSYGLAYGLSAFGLATQLGISNGAARNLMDTYFERFGGVRDYLASVVAAARKVGYTESMLGRRRYLPDLNADNRQLRDMAERMALNAPIQGSAADIVKIAMLKVHAALAQSGLKSRLLLQVHDELVVEVAPDELDAVSALIRENMESAVAMSVPLDVSVGIGRSWTEAAH